MADRRVEPGTLRRGASVVGLLVLLGVGAAVLLGDDGADPQGRTGVAAPAAREEAWSTTVKGPISSHTALPRAVVVTAGSRLSRIDADGSRAWVTSTGVPVELVGRSADGATVLVEPVAGAGVGAYSVESGQEQWFLEDLSYVGSVAAGTLIRAGAGPLGLVDEQAGLVWRVETNDQAALVQTDAASVDTVYVRRGAELSSLDAATGQERWTVQTSLVDADDPALVATERLVVLGTSSQTTAFDAETGESRWSVEGDGGSPQIQPFGRALVATTTTRGPRTVLYGTAGRVARLPGRNESPLDIVSFEVEGTVYAADVGHQTVYDAEGEPVTEFERAAFAPGRDGFFASDSSGTRHYPLPDLGPADYSLPATAGSDITALRGGRVVVLSGAVVTGY